MKTIDSSTQAVIDSKTIETAHLVKMELTSASSGSSVYIHMTEYAFDITYDGNNYDALGNLLAISQLDQSNDLQIQNVTLSLCGLDGVHMGHIFNYEYIDREIIIYRAFLNNGALVGTPVKLFQGRLNQPTIKDDPNSEILITISASSYLSDFDRRPARHTNHTEHTARYPGDNFFRPWGNIDEDIIWGKA